MSVRFKELDRRRTAMGEISLRRRLEPTLQVDVYEVKLGDEFLMSSLFTATEVALAELGLAELPGTDLDVVVGGLGLEYTVSSPCGPTTRPTTTSSQRSNRSSRPARRVSSPFRTRTRVAKAPAPCTSPRLSDDQAHRRN